MGLIRKAEVALRLCRRLADRLSPEGDLAIECTLREALLALAQEDYNAATSRAEDAIRQASHAAMNWERAQGERLLGVALFRKGDQAGARDAFARSDRLFREMGEVFERRLVELWLGAIDGAPQAAHTQDDSASSWMVHPLIAPVASKPDEETETEAGRTLGAADAPVAAAAGATAFGEDGTASRGDSSRPNEVWRRLGLVTRTPALIEMLRTAESLATHSLPILIHGETGTGKELLAQGIHELSGRKGLFLPFNCAACQPELAVVELFGAVKGSYTGADERREGLLLAASGGSIFLDEVADLDAKAQGALLRFLDSGEVRALGSADAAQADTRVIAATHRPLREMVSRGEFRSDLYFRLAGSVLQLPPLRQRVLDFGPLLEHLWIRCGGDGAAFRHVVTEAVIDRLSAMRWPGNVRQLAHVVHVAVVKVLQENTSSARDHLLNLDAPSSQGASHPRTRRPGRPTEADVTDALIKAGGKVRDAARILEVSRGQIYRLMREYGIDHKRLAGD